LTSSDNNNFPVADQSPLNPTTQISDAMMQGASETNGNDAAMSDIVLPESGARFLAETSVLTNTSSAMAGTEVDFESSEMEIDDDGFSSEEEFSELSDELDSEDNDTAHKNVEDH
jgi:hypothetical protein